MKSQSRDSVSVIWGWGGQGAIGVSGGVKGVTLYNANCLITTLIIQK